jgi:hypothetical protein
VGLGQPSPLLLALVLVFGVVLLFRHARLSPRHRAGVNPAAGVPA